MRTTNGTPVSPRRAARTVTVSAIAALAVAAGYLVATSPGNKAAAGTSIRRRATELHFVASAGSVEAPPSAPSSKSSSAVVSHTQTASATQKAVAAQMADATLAATPSQAATVAKTVAALPPAPPGTVASWNAVYQSMYQALLATGVPQSQSGGTGQLPDPTSFDQLTASLSTVQKAELYAVLSSNPNWKSLAATYNQLAASAAAHPLRASSNASTATQSSSASGSHPTFVYHSLLPSSFPPSPVIPTGSFQPPPAPYVPTSPVGPATGIVGCPSPAPGANYGQAAIYGATIAYDVVFSAANFAPTEFDLEVSPPPVGVDLVLPNPVRIVLAVVAGAAQLTEDALAFDEASWTNCTVGNWLTYLGNVDNTTLNTYMLMKQMESTLASLETNVNTLHGQVENVQQSIDDLLTLDIEQALAAPAGSPPDAAYELPASEGGNLNSTPVGVQSVVTATLAAAKKAGLPVNQAATRYLAIANSALDRGFYAAAYADYAYAYAQAAQ